MDEFSDDSFDDLNETVLQELEAKAIQSTQAQKLAQTQHNALEYEFEDDDLDDTVVIDEHAQVAPRPPPQQSLPIQQPRHPAGSQFARPPPPVSRPSPYVPQASQVLAGAGPTNQNELIAALQARLSELESDLTAAKGEASILRSKYDKARATHEADIARLKKETAEQLARQERIIEQFAPQRAASSHYRA
ncbi:hypothetical protein VTH06DRAFT_3077 [Thermothelomyces fergusii]